MGERAIWCSFCGKENTEVFLMIAGSTVFICNECVVLCTEVIAKKEAEVAAQPSPTPTQSEEKDIE